jgi:hypothetical protein
MRGKEKGDLYNEKRLFDKKEIARNEATTLPRDGNG